MVPTLTKDNMPESDKWKHLSTAEKDWIDEHREKNKNMLLRRVAKEFTAKFCRPITPMTICRYLKERKVPVLVPHHFRQPVRQAPKSKSRTIGALANKKILPKFF